MEIYKKLLCLLTVAILSIIATMAQPFPQYYAISNYDYDQGSKGSLHVINYGGSVLPSPDKAIISATMVNTSSGLTMRDLFRSTLQGVHTFTSPFPNYDVSIQLARETTVIGGLVGTANSLKVYGQSSLTLGVGDDLSLLSIAPGHSIFGNTIMYDANNAQLVFGHQTSYSSYPLIGSLTNDSFLITGRTLYSSQAPNLIIDGSSSAVCVGMTTTEFEQRVTSSLKAKNSLFVKNGILSEDYSIAPVDSWADFVFDQNYTLPNLSDVETFISENKHLPDLPSESQVSEEGYSQHEMNKLLLQKIEELTLYTIDQQKQIDQLKTRLSKYE